MDNQPTTPFDPWDIEDIWRVPQPTICAAFETLVADLMAEQEREYGAADEDSARRIAAQYIDPATGEE